MSHFDTLAVHAGEEPDPETGALRTPLHMSTSFRLPRFGIKLFDALTMDSARPPYAYTRWSNPTVRALEDRLAALEGAEAGLAVATGMAAISALALTFLSSGDHLIASEVCYAGAVELFGLHLPRFGIEVSLVDTSDLVRCGPRCGPTRASCTPRRRRIRSCAWRTSARWPGSPTPRARCWPWTRPGPGRRCSGRWRWARTTSSTA